MTARAKKTKPTVNYPILTVADVLDIVMAQIDTARAELSEQMESLRSGIHARLDTATPPATKEPTAFDVSALVGVWIDEQQSEGKTTVDLARVNDIRTGIELGLSLSAGNN